jgi:hypothetical protein
VIGAGLHLQPNILDSDDADYSKHPSTSLYLVAAIILLIDAFICFWDLYLERRHGSVSTLNSTVQIENDEVVLVAEISTAHSVFYLFNNIFFLGGATIYLIEAIWVQDTKTDIHSCKLSVWCGTFWILFWAAFCYRK